MATKTFITEGGPETTHQATIVAQNITQQIPSPREIENNADQKSDDGERCIQVTGKTQHTEQPWT